MVDPDGELAFLDLLRAEAQIALFLHDDRPAKAQPENNSGERGSTAKEYPKKADHITKCVK